MFASKVYLLATSGRMMSDRRLLIGERVCILEEALKRLAIHPHG